MLRRAGDTLFAVLPMILGTLWTVGFMRTVGLSFVVFRLSSRLCCSVLIMLPILGALPRAATGGEPTEQVRSMVDELYRLASPPPRTAAERQARDVAAARTMDPVFDWTAMARQTLRQHWDHRTPAEREEFTRLFSELFRHAYLARISLVDSTAFRYLGDTVTGDRATVMTQVVTKRGSVIGVTYTVSRERGENWRVQDVLVEGISLLDNYRTQFASIIARSSYEALVERLRSRVREHG